MYFFNFRNYESLLAQGQEEIERGKRFDEKKHFYQAIDCYEKGVEHWLRCVDKLFFEFPFCK